MGWMDFGDVRKKRGTPIKKWDTYQDGASAAADARMAEKRHRRALAEEIRKAEIKRKKDRQKQEQKEAKAAAKEKRKLDDQRAKEQEKARRRF